jgi:glycine cleavage system aminomethyltransferase T
MLMAGVILHRLSPKRFLLLSALASRAPLDEWLRSAASGRAVLDPDRPHIRMDGTCSVHGRSEALAVIAVLGAHSRQAVEDLLPAPQRFAGVSSLAPQHAVRRILACVPCRVTRRHAAGEVPAYDMIVPSASRSAVARARRDAGPPLGVR